MLNYHEHMTAESNDDILDIEAEVRTKYLSRNVTTFYNGAVILN